MNNQHRTLSTLASGIGLGLFGRFLGRLLAVISGVIAARVLGPSMFGLYALGLAVLRLGEVLVPLGFDIGVIRYGAIWRKEPKRFRGMFLVSAGITLAFGIAVGFSIALALGWSRAPYSSGSDLAKVLHYVSITIPGVALLSIAASSTRLSQDVKYSFLTQDAGQPFLELALLIFLLWQGWKLESVLLANLLSVLVALLVCLMFLHHLYPFLFRARTGWVVPPKRYFLFSVTSSLSVVFTTLVFWVDRLILGAYLPASDVGIYQAAAQISVIFAVLLSGMNRILTPMFANLFSQSRHNEMRDVYQIATKWALYLGLPLFIVLFMQPQDVIHKIYGVSYIDAAVPLLILLLGQFVNLVTGSVGPLLNVAGYQKQLMLFSGLALLISVALNLILIPRIGIRGAAWATAVSLSVCYGSLLLLAHRKLHMWPFDRRYLKIIIAGILCLDVAALTKAAGTISLIFLLLEGVGIYGLFFVILMLFGLDAEDQLLLSSFAKMLRDRI